VNCDDGCCHKFAILIKLVFLIKVFFWGQKLALLAWLNLLKVLNFSELEESLLVLGNTSSVFVMFHGTMPEKQI
jgi:hypothetical protein